MGSENSSGEKALNLSTHLISSIAMDSTLEKSTQQSRREHRWTAFAAIDAQVFLESNVICIPIGHKYHKLYLATHHPQGVTIVCSHIKKILNFISETQY